MISHGLVPIKKKRGRKRKNFFPQQIGYQLKNQVYQASNKPISSCIKIPNKPEVEYAFHKINKHVENMLDNVSLLLQSNGIRNSVKDYHNSILKLIIPVDMLAYIQYAQNSKEFKQEAQNIMYPNKSWKYTTHYDQNNFDDVQTKYKYSSKNSEYAEEENQKQNSKINYNAQISQDDQQRQLSQIYSKNSEGVFKKRRKKKRQFFDLQLQKQLCEWVKDQIALENHITIDDFIRQAKILAKNRAFSASAAWSRGFFERYPNIKELLSQKMYQPVQIKKVTFDFASQLNDKNQISFSQKIRQSQARQIQQNSQEDFINQRNQSQSDINIEDEDHIYSEPRKKKKIEINSIQKRKLTQKLRQIYQQNKFQQNNMNLNSKNKLPSYIQTKDIYSGLQQNQHENSVEEKDM